jgi:hypothetical protein
MSNIEFSQFSSGVPSPLQSTDVVVGIRDGGNYQFSVANLFYGMTAGTASLGSIVQGDGSNIASGNYAWAIGDSDNNAAGINSFCFGTGNSAPYPYGMAFGQTCTTDEYSMAFGSSCQAQDVHAWAFGNSAVASASYCVAWGSLAVANNSGSWVIGGTTTPVQDTAGNQFRATFSGGVFFHLGSLTIGDHTATAPGTYAIAVGNSTTTATGNFSFAMGQGSTTAATNSFAFGNTAISAHTGSWVIGDSNASPHSDSAANQFCASFAGGFHLYTGSLNISTAGFGLAVAEGSNCKQGVITLTAGVGVVANTSVTANSRIFYCGQGTGVTGSLNITARTTGSGFTITSSNSGDTGVVAYQIFEPAA